MEFQNEEQNQQGFSTGVAGFDRQGKNFHEKYMMQAHEFVQDHLKGITSDQVKKEMAGMGRKMGILLKNDKILNMYGQNRESE